uniref:transglutaminase family protein n=1 Tax=Ningiella ruwaisensis TaxID=2364274 RepID=UPI00109EE862|nr:DUF3488 and transglutaminase-like domain-containing protein [Ningiella ruwaisensis]
MRKLNAFQMRLPSLLVSLSFAFAVLPLADTIMAWVWVLFACAQGVVFAKVFKRVPELNSLTLNLLAIFCMLLLIFFAGQFGLLSTMINLLVVAGCLKLITMRTFADFHLVVIVLIFLVACGFIYHQALLYALYYSGILFATLFGTYLLNKGKISRKQSIRQASKMLAQAIPITILLFVMVPRLPPLWDAAEAKSSSTGLSESITPGDIANLAQSGDLAFRAEFSGAIPEAQDRYWRSIVLDYFDGKTWSMGDEMSNTDNTPPIAVSGPATRYLIIAEPNETRWLYALDVPIVQETVTDKPIFRNQSYQLFTQEVNKKQSLYIVDSYLSAPLNHFMTEYERQRYLQLPSESNPQTRAFVESSVSDEMSEQARLKALIAPFFEQDFAYTLRPPLMQDNPVDQFLFEYQRGFCSHYASALTYMLRLANVPARMVAGYQGGELQNDNILTVRQYDAHAWVEYWIEGSGWTRIDPTAIIAPNRTLAGLLSSIDEQDSELIDRPFTLGGFRDVPVFKQIRDFMVLIDHQWNQSVLRFDQDSQRDLITNLFGAFNAKNMTTFMFLILAAIALFIGAIFLPYRRWLGREVFNPAQSLIRVLEKRGFEKHRKETLQQFIKCIQPDLNEKQYAFLHAFMKRYYAKAYEGKAIHKKEFNKLLKAVKANF